MNRKEGKGNKDLKKGGQAGSRGGCLKNGERTPLRTIYIGWINQNLPNLRAGPSEALLYIIWGHDALVESKPDITFLTILGVKETACSL